MKTGKFTVTEHWENGERFIVETDDSNGLSVVYNSQEIQGFYERIDHVYVREDDGIPQELVDYITDSARAFILNKIGRIQRIMGKLSGNQSERLSVIKECDCGKEKHGFLDHVTGCPAGEE